MRTFTMAEIYTALDNFKPDAGTVIPPRGENFPVYPRPGPTPELGGPPRAPIQDPNDPSLTWWATNTSGGGYYIKRSDVPGQVTPPEPTWTKEDGMMAALAMVIDSAPVDKREAFRALIYRHFEPGWFNIGQMSPVRLRLALGRMDGYDPFKSGVSALQIGQTPEQIFAGMSTLSGGGASSAFGDCTLADLQAMQAVMRQYGVI